MSVTEGGGGLEKVQYSGRHYGPFTDQAMLTVLLKNLGQQI